MKMFWRDKKVLVTGHTGFKGSWLCLWLQQLGAQVIGYALPPPTEPNLFTIARVAEKMTNVIGDIRNYSDFHNVIHQYRPEIIIHMAAQPLVRYSYAQPVETYATNVMGTVHLLEAVKRATGVRAVLNITTDKCYVNKEWLRGYREDEPLGGHDPYSSSKACSELITAAYRHSYGVVVASARAGNVIGGGDWAMDRLIPDIMRACQTGSVVKIRNPQAVRPWQHVLDPLAGYLLLAQRLYEAPSQYAEAWNFGPGDTDVHTVEDVVNQIHKLWGGNARWELDTQSAQPHEATYLKLDCSKVKSKLNWQAHWNLELSLYKLVEWFKAYQAGNDMHEMTRQQIVVYTSEINSKGFTSINSCNSSLEILGS